jgi:hypothetical protein
VREYDVYLPLKYNDGAAVETRKFQSLLRKLLDHFGGVTFFPQPNEGLWRMGSVVYKDEIVIYRILSDRPRKARRFFAKLKASLKKSFRQEEILIVERAVKTL